MESAEGDPGDGQSSGFWDRRKGPWQRGLGPGGVWTSIHMPSMWPEFGNSPSSFSLSLPAAPKGLCFPNVDVEAGNQQVPSPAQWQVWLRISHSTAAWSLGTLANGNGSVPFIGLERLLSHPKLQPRVRREHVP